MKKNTALRTVRKALRDLVIIAASAALLALAEHTADFGLPEAVIPIVSAVALLAYRAVRDWGTDRTDG